MLVLEDAGYVQGLDRHPLCIFNKFHHSEPANLLPGLRNNQIN
jgi:hypothetical protein